MNLNRKTLPALTVAVLVLAVIGAISGIPSWGSVALLLLLLALIAATLRTAGPDTSMVANGVQADSDVPTDVSTAVAEERPPASRVVYDIPLPSAADDYQFSFSATVCWNPIGLPPDQVDLGSAAINAILLRAQRELAATEPTEQELALPRLTSSLALPEPDARQHVRAWAERVQLRLPDQYVESARIRGEFRRKQQIDGLKREAERNFREYLRVDALATPGSATVWWLSRHPEDIERCIDLYPVLRRLSDAANDRTEIIGEPVWQLPPDRGHEPTAHVVPADEEDPPAPTPRDLWAAVETFLDGHDDDQRRMKASQLAKLEDKFSRHDRARDIRQQFAPGSLATGPDVGSPVVAPSTVNTAGDAQADPQAVGSLAAGQALVGTANGRTTPPSPPDESSAADSQDVVAASLEPALPERPPVIQVSPEDLAGTDDLPGNANTAGSYREKFYPATANGGELPDPTGADESPTVDPSVEEGAHRTPEG